MSRKPTLEELAEDVAALRFAVCRALEQGRVLAPAGMISESVFAASIGRKVRTVRNTITSRDLATRQRLPVFWKAEVGGYFTTTEAIAAWVAACKPNRALLAAELARGREEAAA